MSMNDQESGGRRNKRQNARAGKGEKEVGREIEWMPSKGKRKERK